MTLPDFSDISVFEETKISSRIDVEDAPAFFDQHGIFYYGDAAISSKATELGTRALGETDSLKQFKIKDPRLKKILEDYEPKFTYYLAGRKGPYYTLRVTEDDDVVNQAVVYIFCEPTVIEFFPSCHIGPLRGIRASNGLFQIPYPFLRDTRKLVEQTITMNEGGILMLHPRHAFGVRCDIKLIAAYACKRSPDAQR